jgi:hypothetical protein
MSIVTPRTTDPELRGNIIQTKIRFAILERAIKDKHPNKDVLFSLEKLKEAVNAL